MMEAYLHAFEPMLDCSFFLLFCGGPGIGKSLRADRMRRLLCPGWMVESGGGSKKAGQNGGFDVECGRLVYHDEIMKEYCSGDSERLEYLKRISMDQSYSNTRTVPVMNPDGTQTFSTKVLHTHHFESWLMATNCGPLGVKGEEMSDSRHALSDRSISHVAFQTATGGGYSNSEFENALKSPEMHAKVLQFRVISGLTAMVLLYLKHLPWAQPDFTYATRLFTEWDKILFDEYNLPVPSPRKQAKRRMVLLTLVVEAAVVDKFFLQESAFSYPDMLPNEDGSINPFEIAQLVDVVKMTQVTLDFETMHTAWSHSLDHSPATSSHVFHTKVILSQLHGNDLDQKSYDDDSIPYPTPERPRTAERADAAVARCQPPKKMMRDGLSREECLTVLKAMELRRVTKHRYNQCLIDTPIPHGVRISPKDHITKVLGAAAVDVMMPRTQEHLDAGYPTELLTAAAQGVGIPPRCVDQFGLATVGWRFHSKQDQDGALRYDFGWAEVEHKGRKVAADDDKDRRFWNAAVGIMMKTSGGGHSGKIFSIIDSLGMTLNTLRDCLYLLAHKATENRQRIGSTREEHYTLGQEPKNTLVTESGAHFSKQDSSARLYVRGYEKNGHLMGNSIDSAQQMLTQLNVSKTESKIAEMTTNHLLPVSNSPTSVTLGSPIRFVNDSLQFNKYASAEVAAFTLEAATYLALVPGIGIRFRDDPQVPNSFKADSSSNVDDSKIRTLPYFWELNTAFLTLKIGETLAYDADEHIQHVRTCYPAAFHGEELSETVNTLPQIVTRFPGFRNKTSSLLIPVSFKVALEDSRKLDAAENKAASAQNEILSYLSSLHGRPISASDTVYTTYVATEKSALLSKGSVFRRSTWIEHGLKIMNQRGISSQDVTQRFFDRGLFLMNRVRNYEASARTPGFQCLSRKTIAKPGCWDTLETSPSHESLAGPADSNSRIRKIMDEAETSILSELRRKRPRVASSAPHKFHFEL